ncbi:MAG: hypothetical protein VCA55_03575 [Verrucomicrobiales bacterium]
MRRIIATLAILSCAVSTNASPEAINTILAVGPEGKGNTKAAAAWSELAKGGDSASLVQLLAAMDRAGPIASNWLRSAAEVVAGKLEDGGKLSLNELGVFFLDQNHAPRARRFAFELIRKIDPTTAKSLVPGLLNDPSPELRRDAVAQLIKQAASLAGNENKDGAILLYRQALGGAVEPTQIQPIANALKELEVEVDLPRHFGFLMRWQVIGPFDNTKRMGFDTVYPPEKEINLGAEYEGKGAKAKWQPLLSSDKFGKIDLNKPLGMLKETVAYAYTEFESHGVRPAEIRLGCKNAWKIWLNGKLVFGRDEYHRGQRIDQYKLPIQLKAGKNTILVKACQNEQTEEWTVQWEFQLRVCDSTGSAILAVNRQATPQPESAARRPRRPKKSS